MPTFGASAPAEQLFEKFGFTKENLSKIISEKLN
jgi:transketolase